MSAKPSPCHQLAYNHWFFPARLYWITVQKSVADLICCSHATTILNFGCGEDRILEKYLPEHNVIGYDIIKEYSDIDDYRKLRPHTIVCSHVLEHLELSELERTLDTFIAMAPRYIITAQPTENIVSKISWLFSGKKRLTKNLRPAEHKLTINEVHSSLNKRFIMQEKKNVLTLTVTTKWLLKPTPR